MKIKFKVFLIMFLIAILGGMIGTVGVLEINKATNNKIIEKDSSINITTVEYPSIETSNYTVAISKAYNSVVEISSTIESQSFFGTTKSYALGSGVVVSNDGYIVTNNHVIKGAIEVSVRLYNGTNYDATIVGVDPKTDLAVLKIEATDLEFSIIADSDQLILGQECVVIGNPLGEGISCSNGIISALQKEITVNDYEMTVIQTNAAVNEGNSGGGLFNMNGDLIGVVNAKSSSSSFYSSATVEGMGYAIPSNTVSKIVKDLVEYGYVKERATLGVSIYTSATYSDNNISGVIVADVISGGAADKAGIEQYDIITAINETPITSYSALSKSLDKYEVGDEVEITIYRGYGKTMNNRFNQRYELTKIVKKVLLQEATKSN